MTFTLIGNGKMAFAIAKGLIDNYKIEIIGRNLEKLGIFKEKLPDVKIKIIDEQENIDNKNIILCVKPQALNEISNKLTGKANMTFSILAGTTLETLKNKINSITYVRAMPNIAACENNSITSLTGNTNAKNDAEKIFSHIGKTIWLENEKQIDIATAIAGSGPAFLALIAEAITDGGVKLGLPRDISSKLTQGLFSSSSSLLEKNHPALIKDATMSPGGTTAAGYSTLEEYGVRGSMIKTIENTYKKSLELSKK